MKSLTVLRMSRFDAGLGAGYLALLDTPAKSGYLASWRVKDRATSFNTPDFPVDNSEALRLSLFGTVAVT